MTGFNIRNKLFYELIEQLRGNVLEIGFGYGESLKFYKNVYQLTGVELDEKKIAHTHSKVLRHRYRNVRLFRTCDEHLPFDNNCFDAVTGSFILCSVKNPHLLLDEIKRVLKKEGQLILLEHQLLDNIVNKYAYYKFQAIRKYFTSCKLDIDQSKLLHLHGFTISESVSERFLNQKVQMFRCKISDDAETCMWNINSKLILTTNSSLPGLSSYPVSAATHGTVKNIVPFKST